ncbi:MAG: hypothetical protein ACRYFS_16745 [Janthinobacterium lividum]
MQLNILILATPALAGWSILPPTHATIAGIVWQYRGVETTAPKTEVQTKVREASRHPSAALSRTFSLPVHQPMAVFAPGRTAALISNPPFPQATRAP